MMDSLNAPAKPPAAGRTGVEPLGNELKRRLSCREAFAGKKAPLKAALLDQRIVAGLGNIYVCEALLPGRAFADARWPEAL